jgi:putative Holliday junction resolvase
MAKYLGIDYGLKRIGLSVGDSNAKLARPLKTVTSIEELSALLSDEGPFDAVVLGLPRNLDGSSTSQTIAVQRFADDVLWRKHHIEAVFQDEAATSSVAEENLKAAGKPYSKGDIDAEAATIILQDYLDAL